MEPETTESPHKKGDVTIEREEAAPKPVPASVRRKAAIVCISIEVMALILVIVGLLLELLPSDNADAMILTGFVIMLFGLCMAIADAVWFFRFASRCGKIEQQHRQNNSSADRKNTEEGENN
ncbi:MAG: hypothetical protein LUD47_04885 [Clostridia bacterium]|nr:hypothetical protein [Clostridia bacterium]